MVEEGENNEVEGPIRANPLQLLNVIRAEVTHRGLMYIELLTGGQKIMALVDSAHPQFCINKGGSQTRIEAR